MGPRYNAWAIDHDYWDKLTDEERRWLKDFDDAYYFGNFKRVAWSGEAKRVSRNRQNAARRDLYTRAKRVTG